MNALLKMNLPTATLDPSSRLIVVDEVPVSSLRVGDLIALGDGGMETKFEAVDSIRGGQHGSNYLVQFADMDGHLASHGYWAPGGSIRIVTKVLAVTADSHIVTIHERPRRW